MKILILSNRIDAHARLVEEHLKKMSVVVDFFRFEEFVQHCEISFTLGADRPVCLLERKNGDLDLLSYSSIWNRRPGGITAGTFVESWINPMVRSEASAALDGMLCALPCLWMNFPANDIRCTQKLLQLRLATDVGLSIPKTLVTNKPDLVRKFFEDCDGQVVYKLMAEGTPFNIPPSETPAGIATQPLRKEDLPYLGQVVHAPHLFQQYVPKAYELRVTIIGETIFCITIDSQVGQSKIDWRNDYSVPMHAYELPSEVKKKCLALMCKLGLNYGALDFVLTPDGEFVFLEINCAGQYAWIEQRTDLQISLEIAKLLAHESRPLIAPGHANRLPPSLMMSEDN